jgi:hypothetical protein
LRCIQHHPSSREGKVYSWGATLDVKGADEDSGATTELYMPVVLQICSQMQCDPAMWHTLGTMFSRNNGTNSYCCRNHQEQSSYTRVIAFEDHHENLTFHSINHFTNLSEMDCLLVLCAAWYHLMKQNTHLPVHSLSTFFQLLLDDKRKVKL